GAGARGVAIARVPRLPPRLEEEEHHARAAAVERLRRLLLVLGDGDRRPPRAAAAGRSSLAQQPVGGGERSGTVLGGFRRRARRRRDSGARRATGDGQRGAESRSESERAAHDGLEAYLTIVENTSGCSRPLGPGFNVATNSGWNVCAPATSPW